MEINIVYKEFEELSLQELYAIMQLRQEVFIVEQNCPYLDADGKDLKSLHVMLYADKDLAAYCRIVQPGVSYEEVSIGRVISAPAHRKTMMGRRIMEAAISKIENVYGQVPIKIGAQAYLKNFYESFGFVDLNQPYLEDGIPHLKMLRS